IRPGSCSLSLTFRLLPIRTWHKTLDIINPNLNSPAIGRRVFFCSRSALLLEDLWGRLPSSLEKSIARMELFIRKNPLRGEKEKSALKLSFLPSSVLPLLYVYHIP